MTITNERVDDIPVLIARQREMGISELIDKHFEPHGNWEGADYGQLTEVWLSYILSEGDHRLNRMEPWYIDHQMTINHFADEELRANDFRDDRLAILLNELSDDTKWSAFEKDLNEKTIRVYNLETKQVRLDATTVSGHWKVTEDGLFQYGHSKAHRPDLPQLKVMLSTLDPLGLPLVTTVVGGNRADDPLYIPAIEAVRENLNQPGLLFVGDVKMAAKETRSEIRAGGDFYLCPLSATQLKRDKMLELIEPVLQKPSLLTKIEYTKSDGKVAHIADAFEQKIEYTELVDGKEVTWTERRIVTRSFSYAKAQFKALERRLNCAEREVTELPIPKQGKSRPQNMDEYRQAVEQILERRQVKGFLIVDFDILVHEKPVRGYGGKPARIERTEEICISVSRNQAAIDAYEQTLGWRVYVTNATSAQLSLCDAILAYREQYIVERAFGRLKGKPLSLSPMYLEKDDHATGLVRLLSIGLRVLSLLEHSVRSSLKESNSEIAGLYPGNPKRKTRRPSAPLILQAFSGITLNILHHGDSTSFYLAPLSGTQSHLLQLLGFDDSLYLSLTQDHSWNLDTYLHDL